MAEDELSNNINTRSFNGSWSDGPYNDQGQPLYDPTAPVDHTRQNLTLAIICICDALACIIISIRCYIRKRKLKKLRADDWWTLSTGVLILLIWWPTQVAANRLGSGLHWKNVTEDNKRAYWAAIWNYSAYYLICSMVKISTCTCLMNLLPHEAFKRLRHIIITICFFVGSLGIIEWALWGFGCQPLSSNFDYTVPVSQSLDLYSARIIWVTLSVIFDCLILYIPFRILQLTKLQQKHKVTVLCVFGANFLGTAICMISIYGIYENRDNSLDSEGIYTELDWLILNNIEVLMYTLGASFPAFTPYIVSWSTSVSQKSGQQISDISLVVVSWTHRITRMRQHDEEQAKETPTSQNEFRSTFHRI